MSCVQEHHVRSVMTRWNVQYAFTLEETPKGATHWSSRALAARTGLSQSAVSRIWRAFGLPPHRNETFPLSNDPLLVDKVREIVGLYRIHLIMRWYCVWMRRVRSKP